MQHIRVVDGVAKHVREEGRATRSGRSRCPKSFGRVLALSLAGKTQEDYVFAKKPGGKPPGAHATRAYLKKLIEKAGIEKKVTPHKLRHTYATRLLEKDVQLVDIQALLAMKALPPPRYIPMPGRSA